jgi:hypothetical protein
MTHTARALVIGSIVGLGLWAVAVAAVPDVPTPVVEEPIAAHPPASAGLGELMTLPVVGEVVAPLLLAALCGTAAACFSAWPGHAAGVRVARRRRRV